MPLGLVPAIAADYVSSWLRPSFFFGAPAGGRQTVTWWDVSIIALGISGVLTLVWWRWSARPPKQPRCPRCQYDTSHSGLRCPECGHEVADAAGWLSPIRRRWPAFVALALLLAMYPAWATPRVRAMGWLGALPTTVMILGLPWWPDSWVAPPVLTPGMNVTPGMLVRRVQSNPPEWQRDLLRWRASTLIASSASLDRIERVWQVAPQVLTGSDTIRDVAERSLESEQNPQAWSRWAWIYVAHRDHWSPDQDNSTQKHLSIKASRRVADAYLKGDPLTLVPAGLLMSHLDPSISIDDMRLVERTRAGQRWVDVQAASLLLKRSRTTESARAAIGEITGDDQDPGLPLLMIAMQREVDRSSPRTANPVSPERLRELLARPDPRIAQSAFQLLNKSSAASLCNEAQRLRNLAEAGDAAWIEGLISHQISDADTECRRLVVEAAILGLQRTPPTYTAWQVLLAIPRWADAVAFPDAAAWHERLDTIAAAYGTDTSIASAVAGAKAAIEVRQPTRDPPVSVPMD